MLVAVDDWQWLDASSRHALDYAARRLDGAPVGVLATRRPGVSDSAAVETIRLRGLSPAALYRLVEGRLGVSLPRSTVMRLHRTTDGNPFYALEIASALIAAELPGASDPWPIPDDLRDIVAIRVRKLPKSSRAALLVAAASSRARLDARAPSLRPAERAGIVRIDAEGSVRFAHPLYSAAIYDGATEEERRRAHALLADADNDLEEQARHRALATSGADEQVAALLERAASRAQARGATDVAAELGERAVLLTPSDMLDNDRRRRVAAAEYNFRAGDLERARTQLAELVRRTEAPPDSHTLRLLAEVCYRLHHLDEAMPAPPRGDRGGRRRARGDGTCRAGPRHTRWPTRSGASRRRTLLLSEQSLQPSRPVTGRCLPVRSRSPRLRVSSSAEDWTGSGSHALSASRILKSPAQSSTGRACSRRKPCSTWAR